MKSHAARKEHLIRRFEETGAEMRAFFEQLPPTAWDQQVYSEGAAWTVRQVLAHLVQAEDSMRRMVEGILAGGPGVPEDFDLDAYNDYKVSQQKTDDPVALLDELAAVRQQTIELIVSLAEGDLDKTGRHPVLGEAPVEVIFKLIYRHGGMHRRVIGGVLGEGATR